jgi:hypothetical protein
VEGIRRGLPNPDPETVIGAYHHLRQSIEAHLTIVTAAVPLPPDLTQAPNNIHHDTK